MESALNKVRAVNFGARGAPGKTIVYGSFKRDGRKSSSQQAKRIVKLSAGYKNTQFICPFSKFVTLGKKAFGV
jgi:hypothetical protein